MKKVKISDLIPDNVNANRGTKRGSGMLERSLRQYGAGRSVLVDSSGRIIAGNKTVEAAGSIGLEDAVVVETDGTKVVVVKRTDITLDSPQGRGLAIADNRVGEVNLDWDLEALEKIGEELDLGEFFFADELPDLDFDGLEYEDEPTGDADAVPEVEDIPTSKRGDLWMLGDHRILCGDSTNADDVARLMNGEKANLVFTDPPYGIAYNSNRRNLDGTKNVHDPIAGDQNTDIAGLACRSISANIRRASPVFVCTRWDVIREWQDAIVSNGLKVKNCIVWLKSNHGMGDLLGSFGSRWEAILFAHDGGVKLKKRYDDIWDLGQIFTSGRRHHPTEKTTKVARRSIEVTGVCGVVLDLFLGSGSTLIAAEETGRKCYGMEISPQYVDVIVKRWQDYTGKDATHEDGRTFETVKKERSSNA